MKYSTLYQYIVSEQEWILKQKKTSKLRCRQLGTDALSDEESPKFTSQVHYMYH